jgi:hypothetical protein
MTDFTGWTPMRIFWRDVQPIVDWGYLGARRFTDPFFRQTIHRCLEHPANLLFRPQTPLEELGDLVGTEPSLQPTGFIFHLSRCGSTLLSQMLAATPENLVLSEPDPVDTILRAHFRQPATTETQRVQWLQCLVSALGWRRQPAEKNLFIKFDCWHTLFLPLIQRAFPDVPWIFVYREPLEVMVSHLGQRGAQMIPGVLEPDLFGWDEATLGRMPLAEYGARVLAKICEAALAEIRRGNGKLVNYQQLPNLLWPALLEYWNVRFSTEEIPRLRAVARVNAKNPAMPFAADSEAKRSSATAELRALTEHWLAGIYQQLEAQRQSTGFA